MYSKSRPLPKWAKRACFSVLETRNVRKFASVVRKNQKMGPALLSFAIHQCCGDDRFGLLQSLLDQCNHIDRTTVVNLPFGRKNYTPLHRAAFMGSVQVFKFLLCCGAQPVPSPEGETLEEILEAGMAQQIAQAGYTLAKIAQYSPRSLYYTVILPNGKRAQFSTAVIEHRKYTQPGHVWVPTPDTRSNCIFIKERFRHCHTFLQKRKEEAARPVRKKVSRKKMIPKQVAALKIQRWWKKKPVELGAVEEDPFDAFRKGQSLPTRPAEQRNFLLKLMTEGKQADFQNFLEHEQAAKLVEFLRNDEELAGIAMDDCPILLKKNEK